LKAENSIDVCGEIRVEGGMKIYLNERAIEVESGIRLEQLKANANPAADVVIYNGAAVSEDVQLQEGDHVNLIQRGAIPSAEELEALMVARHTPGVHAKIRQSTVGIAGLGGLGSAIAVALARIGVGRLVLVDFDVVEPSNLNRQQYFVDQLGLSKAEALTANLKRINPYVTYEAHRLRVTPDNIPSLFGEVAVLVEAFDRADQKAMLLQSWVGGFPGKPLVAASGLAGYGSGETIGVKKMGKQIYVVGDLTTGAEPGCGLMAPRVGIAAHMQANVVLRLLLGEEV
jgi:sulfur carrier protein ThiS adenylyltransferase